MPNSETNERIWQLGCCCCPGPALLLARGEQGKTEKKKIVEPFDLFTPFYIKNVISTVMVYSFS
jgi:hypothetical protein